MRIELNDDALAFGAVVRDALGAAGGDQLIQHAEADPDSGGEVVGRVLEDLGAWDLDLRSSGDQLEAAAAVCRAAGWWAAPGAVAERLCRAADLDADALCVVGGPRPAAAVHASPLRWIAVDLDGSRSEVTARPIAGPARAAAFVADVELTPIDRGGTDDAPLGLVLPCWTLLGMLDRAIGLTIEYVRDRHQFGRPLAAFQAVQFQLTEAEVERAGVEELAKYALWSVATGREDALVDALALRLAAVRAADVVFRIGHQLHGAIGFCDETTISWLSRYSRPIRTLPVPLSGTRAELTRRVGRRGLTGPFSVR